MKFFRVTSFIAAFMAIWAVVKLFRVVGSMLASFVAALAAIWTYDTYKADKPAIERKQPATPVESTAWPGTIEQEQIQYGLQTVVQMRVEVEVVYQQKGGVFPNSNKEAGLRPPEDYRSDILASVRVGHGGSITVSYAAFPGIPEAWLRLAPKVSDENLPILWRCESNIPEVSQMLDTCAFVRRRGGG